METIQRIDKYEKGISKYFQVKRKILDFVRENQLAPGYRFLSTDELSELFGVNRLTVNRAMGELAQAGIIERIPGVGSLLKEVPRAGRITILLPSLWVMEKDKNPEYWFITQEVMQGINNEIRRRDLEYEILEMSTFRDAVQEMAVIRGKRGEGIIVLGDSKFEHRENFCLWLKQDQIPFVVACDTTEEFAYPHIFVDKKAGTKEGVNHLIWHGHCSIAFVGGELEGHPTRVFPLEGYKDAFLERGWKVRKEWIWLGLGNRKILERIKETGVTGIFCSTDLKALELLDILRKEGIKVGRDIGIVSYDDIYESSHSTPALTTLNPQRRKVGSEAVRMLESLIKGEEPEQVRLVPYLLLRESCGCKNKIMK